MIDGFFPDEDLWPPALTPDEARVRMRAERRFGEARLQLFRSYMGLILRRASPILIDLAEFHSLDMPALLRRMRPAGVWSDHRRILNNRLGGGAKGRRLTADARNRLWGRVPMFREGDPDLHLQITMERDVLQTEFRLGDAACYGIGGGIELWVRGSIPETLADGAVGRPLATVVHHELFEGREYLIRSVLPNIVGWSIIVAEAPAEPIPEDWLGGA